jgi:dTMP kinase
MRGVLIVFEGLDQSGKQTQAALLQQQLQKDGRTVRLLSFPDYTTPIGTEIHRALHGEREYTPDVMQLLYVANRFERRPSMEQALAAGEMLVCDRYAASTIAYGEAQGLDAGWLAEIQRGLPLPDATILLDIDPAVAARRKAAGRDRYERDLAMLARVRDSYLRQADAENWIRLDADRDRGVVAADILTAIGARLARR